MSIGLTVALILWSSARCWWQGRDWHGFTRLPIEAPTLALDLVKLRRLGDGP